MDCVSIFLSIYEIVYLLVCLFINSPFIPRFLPLAFWATQPIKRNVNDKENVSNISKEYTSCCCCCFNECTACRNVNPMTTTIFSLSLFPVSHNSFFSFHFLYFRQEILTKHSVTSISIFFSVRSSIASEWLKKKIELKHRSLLYS